MKKLIIYLLVSIISLSSYSQHIRDIGKFQHTKVNKIDNKDLKEIGFIEVMHSGKRNYWLYMHPEKSEYGTISIMRVDRLFRNRYFIFTVYKKNDHPVMKPSELVGQMRLGKYDYFDLLSELYFYVDYQK